MAKNLALAELELMSDPKYRSFVTQIDKALKGFEYTSEWADLVNALGKLNKVLQNNTKYSVIPRRFIVGQRLAQCMHPALPSGVHLKALETYDLIFKCIGTDKLVQELSVYSNGLFPLLSHAAINVKPTLLEIYETHFVPLGERLRPALDGFLIAVLPGLEEGSDHHDTTDNLLKKVCEGSSNDYFYGSLWRCILNNPSVRLPAVSFITSHFNKKKSLEDQLYFMGTNIETLVNGVCAALLDPNVLVQRAILDLLLCCFPMHNSQILASDMISITTAAVTVLLRRDISLNRRLYSWFFGLETNVGSSSGLRDKKSLSSASLMSTSSSGSAGGHQSSRSKRKRETYFENYSKELVSQAFILCLVNPSNLISTPNAWSSLGELWPYRLLICLLDNPEISKPLVDTLSTEVFRALCIDCKKEKVRPEMLRTANLLLSNLGIAYSWRRLSDLFSDACHRLSNSTDTASHAMADAEGSVSVDLARVQPVGSGSVTISEMCAMMDFMIDVTSIDNYPETTTLYLPSTLSQVLENLTTHCKCFNVKEFNATVQLATKMVSKIQPCQEKEKECSAKSVADDSELLKGIQEECESIMSTESERTREGRSIDEQSPSPEEAPSVETFYENLVSNVEMLYSTFVCSKLVLNPNLMHKCYLSLLSTVTEEERYALSSPGLSISLEMVSVYTNLCQLLLKTTLMQKASGIQCRVNYEGLAPESRAPEEALPCWLQHLLVLSCFSREASVSVSYCSMSTYLGLVSILKALLQDLPLPSTFSVTPSSSPVLDFNSNTAKRSPGFSIESLLTSSHLNFIYQGTGYYTKVTQLLWDNLSDDYCDLHLETANLLQQVHNLAEDSSVCESVICTAMASSDETESYEARKRFCTLYNITRDLKLKAAPFNRREFDRPLFFMLDGLTHKLDSHNTQAMDWLNQCLKNGDIARILEPLLFILLHPDTGRVSVQHVNIHQPEVTETGKSDEADNAALAAAEARIYAISSTGGNIIYHVNPEGRKKFASSPVPSNKILALTSQNNHSNAKSQNNKWITSKFNLPEYEVPPSHEQNITSGKSLSINMVFNPFGSLSSLTSDALESLDANSVTFAPSHPDLSNVRRLDTKRYVKSTDDVRKTPTPNATPTPSTTPVPSRFSKISSEDSDNLSDNVVIANLMDEIVEAVADKLEGDDDESQSSSSTSATTTRQTMSESISISSWAKPVSVNQLHSHILLYTQVYDSRRTLYALTTLWNIILSDPQRVLFSLATTSISNRLGFRSQELQALCARHRKSLFGRGFNSDLDTESSTAFRSSSFLEVIVTTCLYYVRSYYPGLPQSRLNEDEILGNQRVRILSCEILRLIFCELVTAIRGRPTFSSYLHDMLMRCKVQKVVLHSVVSSVYNLQFKASPSGFREQPQSNEDVFSDTIVEFNEKLSASFGFQEDMQKSVLKLLEQLVILEHRASPSSSQPDKELPTHNRKQPVSRASKIRFQPQMSSLKYCPNVPIASQLMFLSAIQAALQPSHKAVLHSNWLSLVEASLPFAGRSLTKLVVCVISQLCHNLESFSDKLIQGPKNRSEPYQMPPNYLIIVLKSLSTLCHYCLLDTSNAVSTPTLSPQPQPPGVSTAAAAPAAGPLQVISNFLHVFANVEGMADVNPENNGSNGGDPLLSTRRTVLSHLPRILAALLNIWKAVSLAENDNYSANGWEVMGNGKDVKQSILAFLSPISLIHGSNFMGAVAVVWYDLRDLKVGSDQSRAVIPTCSQHQSILVDLIAAIRVLPMESVLQTVKVVMKQPPQTTHARKKGVPLEVCMLQFFLAYIRVFPGSQLLECWKSLLSLLKDGLQVSSAQPLAQFHLLAILHEFVQSAPLIEDRKDQKDLQDVAQKLVDACTTVAGARLGQTRWLRRNLEVKPGPQHDHELEDDSESQDIYEPSMLKIENNTASVSFDPSSAESDNSFLAKYSVRALNALAEFVAPVLDVVYVSEEKEKVVPLVSNIMYYVTPYLRNHSKHNAPSFRACSHLLSSISGYQYSRKAWRKDAFELLLDPCFFQMDGSCMSYWKIVVDHLMTHDKTTFRDFLSRMSVNQSGSALKLFSSKDQENEQRAQLAKRLAFILFCSEKDQYQRYMPEIQEKLIECLRVNSSPIVQSQILFCFRVLILRMSAHHLTSLWPFIYTEMFQAFLQIEMELMADTPEFSSQLQRLNNSDSQWVTSQSNGLAAHNHPAWLQQYLFACKLLDLAIALPADSLPQFQMYRWAFVGVASVQTENLLIVNNNNLNGSNHLNDNRSPSPVYSRTSSTNSSANSRTQSVASPPFEPHIIRIERSMRAKNPNPTLLKYRERYPLITQTQDQVKSLLELHPFFFTLMKSCQQSNANGSSESPILENGVDHVEPLLRDTSAASVSASSPTPSAAVTASPLHRNSVNAEDLTSYMDRILENDFLENIPDN